MIKQFRLPLLVALLLATAAVPRVSAEEISAAPSAVQVQRADKITGSLTLADAAKTTRVRDLIAHQYYDLSVIHAKRDDALKAAKTLAATDKPAADAAIKTIRADAETAQNKLHAEFLAKLAVELTTVQIDQVKDGMTYGVLPLTYRVYQEMLPDLTAEQKAQILAWLTEAREHAMDGSTSDEKHAWFGKYKGRINNYLSKAGIDMKQAEREMSQRQKPTIAK